MWKQIENYPEYYVSEFGEIKSVKWGKERLLRRAFDKRGYWAVTIYGEKRHTTRNHILVAKMFHPNPQNKPQVNHKDGDKNNNHYSNLEWCTIQENMAHAHANGLRNSKKAKLDYLDTESGIYYSTQDEIANMLGIKKSAYRVRLRLGKYGKRFVKL
jgi:hypothetical protein